MDVGVGVWKTATASTPAEVAVLALRAWWAMSSSITRQVTFVCANNRTPPQPRE
jgi:hypothetical protein